MHMDAHREDHMSFPSQRTRNPAPNTREAGNLQPTWLVVIIDFDAGWFQVLHLNYLFQLQNESLRFIVELVEMEGN